MVRDGFSDPKGRNPWGPCISLLRPGIRLGKAHSASGFSRTLFSRYVNPSALFGSWGRKHFWYRLLGTFDQVVNLRPIFLNGTHADTRYRKEIGIRPRARTGNISQSPVTKDPEGRQFPPLCLGQPPSAQCLLQASLPLRWRRVCT